MDGLGALKEIGYDEPVWFLIFLRSLNRNIFLLKPALYLELSEVFMYFLLLDKSCKKLIKSWVEVLQIPKMFINLFLFDFSIRVNVMLYKQIIVALVGANVTKKKQKKVFENTSIT